MTKEDPNPSALNQYNSLNRQTRIRELARIVDDNKQMLGRLQTTKSSYNGAKWEHNFQEQKDLGQALQKNSDRFNKNPYFLHSVCTQDLRSTSSSNLHRKSR